MLLTPHVLVGTAIASVIPNPLIAAPLSFISHFAGDLVPHWDFYTGTTKEERLKGWRPLAVMGDLAVGVFLGTFFTLYGLWVVKSEMLALNIFISANFAVLPDVLTGPDIYLNGKSNVFFKAIHNLQSKLQFPMRLPWGIISQIVVSLLCSLVILNSIVL
jgi:hypothetical protein